MVGLGRHGNDLLNQVALCMNSPGDQAKLAEWMAAVHWREATLEEIFIDVACERPAKSRKGERCTLV